MLTKVISLKKGLEISGEVHKELEIREGTLGDLMDAEEEASPANPISFRATCLCLVAIRFGSYTGPITPKMLRGLSPSDWDTIASAMREFDKQGEESLASEKAS